MTDLTPSQLPLRYRLMRRGLQALSYTLPPVAARISLDMFSTPTRRPVRSGKTKRILADATRTMIPYNDPDLSAFQDLSVAVYAWGQPENPPVLLAHGWEGQAGSFRDFVGPLLDAGFYVVAFDAPAHGESSGARANLLVFMNTLRAVARHYGPFEAVVGHSLGGIAAIITRGEPPIVETRRIVVLAAPQVVTGAFEAFVRFWGLPDHTLQGMYRLISQAVGRSVRDFSVESVAGEISVPVLIIHDTDDTDVRYANGEAIRDLLPNATLHTTHGLGHQRILRDSAVVEQVVAFVTQR